MVGWVGGEVFFTRSVRARRRGAVSRRNGREKTLKIDYKYNTSPVFRDITLDLSNAGGGGRERGPKTDALRPRSVAIDGNVGAAREIRTMIPGTVSTRRERAPDPFSSRTNFEGPHRRLPSPFLASVPPRSISLRLILYFSYFVPLCSR